MAQGFSILVTGGAGYLGSILVPRLLEDGHRVTVFDNFMFGQVSLAHVCANPNLEIVRGDVRDHDKLVELARKADIVIPLAALVGAPLCARDPDTAKAVNRDAIAVMLQRLSKDQRVIYPTTNSGYGIGEPGKACTEETPLRPISLYGRTKSDAEKAVLDFGSSVAFRLATVFGMSPRLRLDLLVNDFVYRAVTDRAVVLFEAHFIRNYIHIRDVAGAFVHAIGNFERMKGEGATISACPTRTRPKPISPRPSSASASNCRCRISILSSRRSARTRTSATTSSRTKRSREPGFARATRSTTASRS